MVWNTTNGGQQQVKVLHRMMMVDVPIKPLVFFFSSFLACVSVVCASTLPTPFRKQSWKIRRSFRDFF